MRAQIVRWRQSFALYIIPLIVVVMGINIMRLSLMARSREAYFFYHDGLGADIINAIILLVAMGIALIPIMRTNLQERGAYAA